MLYYIYIDHFSNETPLQTPTGGTAGLCFKKLNITTPSYRIIINRLDRKVNAGLILSRFSSHARQLDSFIPVCTQLSSGDSKLQNRQAPVLASLSLCGGHRQHVLDPNPRWSQHAVVSQHRHHGAAVHHHLQCLRAHSRLVW